jgi:hypothetical protein
MPRVRHCGRFASGDHVTVRVTPGGAAGFGGVQSCGSVWACPVCSEKVNAERQADLTRGIAAWLAAGHAVVLGTLTMRHNKGHRLAELWDAIGPAWNRTTSGAGVAWNGSKRVTGDIGDKARFGIDGYVRVVETKHGGNGWHPHIHFLLFLDAPLTSAQTQDLSRRMFARWETALAKSGFSVVEEHGIDLRPVKDAALADYFTKGTYTSSTGAAYEVTGSHSKKAGKGGRTPFELLAAVVEEADADALDLWHEWEKASKGRRQLTWSRGLRSLLGLDDEKTDEEIVEEDEGGETEALLGAGQYRQIARVPGRLCEVLEAAEKGDGGCSLVALLHGWGYRDVRPRFKRREPSLFAS